MPELPQLPPPPDVDRQAFRRALLDGSVAATDLAPELRFLTPRLAAVAAILDHYPDVYLRLVAQREADGPSPELEREALALAADIATVAQSLRGREDLLAAVGQTAGMVAPPMVALDQLFSAFLLVAGGDDYLEAAPGLMLDAEEMPMWMDKAPVTEFIASVRDAS